MRRLDVYMAGTQIGVLRESDAGALTFSYAPEWARRSGALAIVPLLPLGAAEHGGAVVRSYFDNLLPEGSIRDFVAQAEHISPNNTFGLLLRFAGDTAGALSLVPHGEAPSLAQRYLAVSSKEIRAWFANSRGIPLRASGEQARMSLSGAQDKLTVRIAADGQVTLPLGTAPSTHILKPSMGYRAHLPQTAVNETLVMKLAAAVGLLVPVVRYSPELDAAVIARYDRTTGANGDIQRLHQNDLCQMMGLPSAMKYESEGGPTIKACFDAVVAASSQPALDKKRLLEWIAFNLLIENMDSHAKNLSMLRVDGRYQLAPFYDMLCTRAYPNLSKRFAFKIGGENRPDWMLERKWAAFAGEVGVKPQFVAKVREDVRKRVKQHLPVVASSLRAELSDPESISMVNKIETIIARTSAHGSNSAPPAAADDSSDDESGEDFSPTP
jgi:serine/threonine-protein kinase HipA